MNRCPITYQHCENEYSEEGLKKLSPALTTLKPLAYSAEELRREAAIRSTKISIQGVQPKLSARLNVKNQSFDVVDIKGTFILKPQHYIFQQVPENEDLTMKLANLVGIEVPVHGLIKSKDKSFCYFIKRFDRIGPKRKLAVEDFAQLAGLTRDTKYNYTIEKLILLVDKYCTFPMLDKAKLFRRILFNFLVGNEDMHLKNYSIIKRNKKIELSPGYDFVNTSIILSGDIEETALKLKGKNKNLNHDLLVNYLGKNRLGLSYKTIENTLQVFSDRFSAILELIENSFLNNELQEKYIKIVNQRIQHLSR